MAEKSHKDEANVDNIFNQDEDRALKLTAAQNLYNILRQFNKYIEDTNLDTDLKVIYKRKGQEMEECVLKHMSLICRPIKPSTETIDVDSQIEYICMDLGSNMQINATNEFNKRSRIDTDEFDGASTLDYDMDLFGDDNA